MFALAFGLVRWFDQHMNIADGLELALALALLVYLVYVLDSSGAVLMATIVVYSVLLILLTPPLGAYLYRVYTREQTGRLERVFYRILGVNPEAEQSWRRYADLGAVVQPHQHGPRLPRDALAAAPAAQPGGLRRASTRTCRSTPPRAS